MASVNGGYLVAKALKNEEVDTVFTLTGGHIMPILNALVEFGIKVIDCRHECAAAYAADAYAKVSGRPGVLITTAGPGVTNTMTAMAEASETTVPIVHIGGAAVQSFFDMGMMQDVNTLGAMSAFCKFAKKVTIPRRIPEYIAMAFRHALDDTPGPVYLEMPMDILAEKYGGLIEDEGKIYYPEKYRTDAIAFGDPDLIKEAAKLLASAKKPVLVLGEQARFNTKYGEYVERLVNYLKMPVFISPLALIRGTYADESKNELFAIGNAATTQADVILELCANNHGLLGYARAPLFNAAAKIIQVHPDRLKIGYNTKADVGIVAGAGAASKQLLEEIEKLTQARKDDAWVDEARKLNGMARSFYTEAAADNGFPIHPGRLAAEVAKFLAQSGQDWHIACDGGDSGVWMAANAVARYPGQILRFGNMGTIGTGPGMAIGGWAADKKPVLYYTGDGS
ncbi:MAG: hypothetical protein LBQ19_03920, partial [Synergistaceae bacterium]|nr:hypothetical protein [Synergistaceae bacterium]